MVVLSTRLCRVIGILLFALLFLGPVVRDRGDTSPSDQARRRPVVPLDFEQNVGQTDDRVGFVARTDRYIAFFTAQATIFRLHGSSTNDQDSVVRFGFVNANEATALEGLEQLPGKSHYLIGRDSSKWHRDVPHFRRVRYRDLYPGISAVFYGNPNQLEYDVVVEAGADPRPIAFSIDGADRVALDPRGALLITTADGTLLGHRPLIYQEIDGVRREIEGRYSMRGPTTVGFDIDDYDATRELIIDPVLSYSTYLGGSGFDDANAIAIDREGNAFVAGITDSADFPATPGAWQTTGEYYNAFVAKLNADGTQLLYATYLGGARYEFVADLALDSLGHVYLIGDTDSFDFPTTPGAFQREYAVRMDAFITKLNATGSNLDFSTLVGGNGWENGASIALHASGRVYAVMSSSSTDLVTTINALQPASRGMEDIYVIGLDPSGARAEYGAYIGGSNLDRPASMTLDAAGHVYVSGSTSSSDFPTTPGAYRTSPTPGAFSEGFLTKIDPAGTSLVYSTYLGAQRYATALAVDTSGNAYVACSNTPSNFGADAFALKFSATGNFGYEFPLRGSEHDEVRDIVVDAAGRAWLIGLTQSANFPTFDALQAFRGGQDAFVARINAAGNALEFSTFFGGSGWDRGTGIAIDDAGNVFVAGVAGSSDFPTTPRVVQPRGGGDTFVAKISTGPSAVAAPTHLHVRSRAGNTVTFAWDPPYGPVTPTNYVLEGGVVPGQTLASIATNSTAQTFSLEVPTGVFFVRLHSIAGSTRSGASNEIRIAVNALVPPTRPENLLFYVDESSVRLTWMNTAPPDQIGGIVLDVSGPVSGSFALAPSETFGASNVPAGTYRVSARTVNGLGLSDPSNAVTFLVPGFCSGPPDPPRNFRLLRTGRTITATWDLAARGFAPDSYTIQITRVGGLYQELRTKERTFTTTLEQGTFWVYATAINPCGGRGIPWPVEVVIP